MGVVTATTAHEARVSLAGYQRCSNWEQGTGPTHLFGRLQVTTLLKVRSAPRTDANAAVTTCLDCAQSARRCSLPPHRLQCAQHNAPLSPPFPPLHTRAGASLLTRGLVLPLSSKRLQEHPPRELDHGCVLGSPLGARVCHPPHLQIESLHTRDSSTR